MIMHNNSSQRLKLVILDCDGVMFDSFRSNVAYYNNIMERMNEPPLNQEAKRLCHVYSTPQLFAYLFPDDPDKVRQGKKLASTIDYLPFLEYLDPEPGLFEVLNELKAHYRIAVATNRGISMPPLLKRFRMENTFEVVATITMVKDPKPSPDLLNYCLQHTAVAPQEAVYVGDMDNDRIAAEAAGIPFILVGDNIQHPHRIQTLTELPKLLRKGT